LPAADTHHEVFFTLVSLPVTAIQLTLAPDQLTIHCITFHAALFTPCTLQTELLSIFCWLHNNSA